MENTTETNTEEIKQKKRTRRWHKKPEELVVEKQKRGRPRKLAEQSPDMDYKAYQVLYNKEYYMKNKDKRPPYVPKPKELKPPKEEKPKRSYTKPTCEYVKDENGAFVCPYCGKVMTSHIGEHLKSLKCRLAKCEKLLNENNLNYT